MGEGHYSTCHFSLDPDFVARNAPKHREKATLSSKAPESAADAGAAETGKEE